MIEQEQQTLQQTIQQEKRKRIAALLCSNAKGDPTAVKLAERLTREWFECGCEGVRADANH